MRVIVGVVLAVMVAACDDEVLGGGEGGSPGSAPFTEDELQALVDVRCNPCHITRTTAGLNFSDGFVTATVNVPSTESDLDRIEPGDRDASYLYHKIRGSQADAGGRGVRMPANGPPFLSDEEIERIGLWIDGL